VGAVLPALKRMIRVEALFRSAEALLPPHECGGSHHESSGAPTGALLIPRLRSPGRPGQAGRHFCLGVEVCNGEFGRADGRTTDPSTTLGMTKGGVAFSVEIGLRMRGTAGPSTTLRSGRDDTSVWLLCFVMGEG
jgi:hypothetical protein